VVSARRRCRTTRRKRLGAPSVGTQPPASGGRLVGRTPHKGVPEAEAAGHVGVPDEIEVQELVDCVHRLGFGRRSSGRRQLGIEWIARHRRALQETTSAVGQQSQLFA
jgi:hypothetical protein